jgi:hypothetical protein
MEDRRDEPAGSLVFAEILLVGRVGQGGQGGQLNLLANMGQNGQNPGAECQYARMASANAVACHTAL